ncbi:MAG: dihydroorotate dehydrogenase (quinone), partial [Solirubrobacterales bacterium]
RVGDELVIGSVGGVESARDVADRLAAGATLVQAYTAFIYGGPLWPSRVQRGLARQLRDAGSNRAADDC